jgi:hypothetical protein
MARHDTDDAGSDGADFDDDAADLEDDAADRDDAGAGAAEYAGFDVVRELLLDPRTDPEAGKDATLGGYIAKHDRPPAFEGSDGQPYSVGLDVEPAEDVRQEADAYVGFLVFVRWAATGAGIMSHAESGDLSRGTTEEEARQGLLALSLYRVKEELDAAIERHRTLLEED